MEAPQHVHGGPDRNPGTAHGLVADDNGLQRIGTLRTQFLRQRQHRRHHHGARMGDRFLVDVVELEGMRRCAVGEGCHGRRGAAPADDRRAG